MIKNDVYPLLETAGIAVAPELELKPLSNTLQYWCFGRGKTISRGDVSNALVFHVIEKVLNQLAPELMRMITSRAQLIETGNTLASFFGPIHRSAPIVSSDRLHPLELLACGLPAELLALRNASFDPVSGRRQASITPGDGLERFVLFDDLGGRSHAFCQLLAVQWKQSNDGSFPILKSYLAGYAFPGAEPRLALMRDQRDNTNAVFVLRVDPVPDDPAYICSLRLPDSPFYFDAVSASSCYDTNTIDKVCSFARMKAPALST